MLMTITNGDATFPHATFACWSSFSNIFKTLSLSFFFKDNMQLNLLIYSKSYKKINFHRLCDSLKVGTWFWELSVAYTLVWKDLYQYNILCFRNCYIGDLLFGQHMVMLGEEQLKDCEFHTSSLLRYFCLQGSWSYSANGVPWFDVYIFREKAVYKVFCVRFGISFFFLQNIGSFLGIWLSCKIRLRDIYSGRLVPINVPCISSKACQ